MNAVVGSFNRLVTEGRLFLAGVQPGDYDPTSGKGPEWGKAAPVALLIIVLMGIALVFLIKSMNKQLRKVPAEFGAPGPAAPPADQSTAGESPGDNATSADER